MQEIIHQWDNAALKFMEGQENSEYAESNKRVVKNRFRHFNTSIFLCRISKIGIEKQAAIR